MKQRARAWAIVIATAMFPLSSGAARAESPVVNDADSDVAQAERYASLAFEAYGRGAFAEAVELYKLAYSSTPDADIILYNIARTYDLGLRDRALAIEYYARYAASANASPQRIEKVRRRIAELADGLAGSADDATPNVAPPLLDETVRPEAEAPRPAPAPSPPSAPAPTPSAPTPRNDGMSMTPAAGPLNTAAWTPLEVTALAVGGIGVAAVGVGVGFGVSASAQTDIWRRDCEGNICASERGVAAAKSAASKARVATAGFVAGTALVAAGSVLWFVAAREDAASSGAMLHLTPMAGPSEIGGALSGRF
jgi:tetratricopeptide (TPR) repeat protein